ncbi:hypothetical protein [Streptomyces sp. NPDC005784]|uniref:hypothetical protein n=1 Tax=Streptomyces sp. NPDC005784 TaxID=3364731 RepID=UPI00369CA81A
MSSTLFRGADLIESGDLVIYHGSKPDYHGLYIALPCPCRYCYIADVRGTPDARYALVDPWGEHPRGLVHVRRQSITRSVANS